MNIYVWLMLRCAARLHISKLVVDLAVEERLLIASQSRLEPLFDENTNCKYISQIIQLGKGVNWGRTYLVS